MKAREVKTKSVVMPVSLAKWFEDFAEKNYRNFSNEVVRVLEEKRNEIESAKYTKN